MVVHEYDKTTKIGWMNVGSVAANVETFDLELKIPVTYVRFRVRPRNENGFGPWSSPSGVKFNIPQTDAANKPVAATNLGLAVISTPTPPDPGEPPTPPTPPTPPNPTVANLTPTSGTIATGGTISLRVTLSGAYDSNVTVTLNSADSGKVSVPASVVVPTGQTTADFVASGVAVGSSVITASYNSTNKQSTITVAAPVTGNFLNEPPGMVLKVDEPWNVTPGTWGTLGGSASGVIVSDPTAPISPNNVLQAIYDVGFPAGIGAIRMWQGLNGLRDEVFLGLVWKCNANWQQEVNSGTSKICFFVTNTNQDIFYGMTGPQGGPYRIQVAAEFPGISNTQLAQSFGDPVGTRNIPPNITTTPIVPGNWYKIEWYMKYSTTDTSQDGILKLWINDTLNTSHTNMNYPHTSQGTNNIDPRLVEFSLNPTWGGANNSKTQTDYFWFDHIRLSYRG